MKQNPYENLRVDNRARLPQPWENYPVLKPGAFKTEIVYIDGYEHAKIHLGQQDGVFGPQATTSRRGNAAGDAIPAANGATS